LSAGLIAAASATGWTVAAVLLRRLCRRKNRSTGITIAHESRSDHLVRRYGAVAHDVSILVTVGRMPGEQAVESTAAKRWRMLPQAAAVDMPAECSSQAERSRADVLGVGESVNADAVPGAHLLDRASVIDEHARDATGGDDLAPSGLWYLPQSCCGADDLPASIRGAAGIVRATAEPRSLLDGHHREPPADPDMVSAADCHLTLFHRFLTGGFSVAL